jgi:uncharacterized SAM-binding protein YcdF (DUF218 family)
VGFLLAKLLSSLAMPLAAGCLLLLAGLLFSWRRPGLSRAFVASGVALLAGLGSGLGSDRLLGPLERAYPVPPATLRAEAAVVLAGTVDLRRSTLDRIEFYDRPERLIEGARLVREGRARWLVISGGSGDPEWPDAREADFLVRFATDLGVPRARILMQRESRTTAEDALYTARLLREKQLRPVFLVTSAFHMPRAMGCFRKAGVDPIAYPVDFRATPRFGGIQRWMPTAEGLLASTLALHEYVGYVTYRVGGRL